MTSRWGWGGCHLEIKTRFQKFEFSNSEVSPTVYTDLKGPHPLSCQVVYRYLFNVKISLRPYSPVWKKKLTPHMLLLGMIFLPWFLRVSANYEPYGLNSVAGSVALSWLGINSPVVTWSKSVSCRKAPFQEKKSATSCFETPLVHQPSQRLFHF